jgi:hypothetical protein
LHKGAGEEELMRNLSVLFGASALAIFGSGCASVAASNVNEAQRCAAACDSLAACGDDTARCQSACDAASVSEIDRFTACVAGSDACGCRLQPQAVAAHSALPEDLVEIGRCQAWCQDLAGLTCIIIQDFDGDACDARCQSASSEARTQFVACAAEVGQSCGAARACFTSL